MIKLKFQLFLRLDKELPVPTSKTPTQVHSVRDDKASKCKSAASYNTALDPQARQLHPVACVVPKRTPF
jgi:hypothetical protein